MRLAPSNGLSLTPSCFSTHATAAMVLKTSELACQKHSRNRISRQTAESPEDRGQSCKRGCAQQFTISKLYEYSEVAQVSMKHSEHTDKAGKVAHGSSLAAQGVRDLLAPHVSDKMKDWVIIKVNDGCKCNML